MALNYSHRPMSPAHISDDNLVSSVSIMNGYLVEGLSERNVESYSRPWHVGRVEADERSFSHWRDRVDSCSTSESTSNDIIDLLPSDPFGMDIKTTFTAITGWLEDLEVDCGVYMRSNNWGASQEDYGLFAGWNFIWNNSLKHQSVPCNIQLNEKLNARMQSFSSNSQANEKSNIDNSYPPRRAMSGDLDKRDIGNILAPHDIECQLDIVESSVDFDGAPHEALNYVLSYLGVKDLLSVERVCSSLSCAVRGDPLVWRIIHIDQPLNERITDDALVQLASRAQGRLESLSLMECSKVTDDGLRRIFDTNRRLTKLYVPGCTRITIECIVSNIREYNFNNEFGGIKHLRIGGLYGVNHEHFEELDLLLGSVNKKTQSQHKPHFYHRGNFYLPYDDDRSIDIEMCPKCEKFRLVFDCPAEGCKVKDKSPVCRACILCIGRCVHCGRCTNGTEFEEMFNLELLCSGCVKQLHLRLQG